MKKKFLVLFICVSLLTFGAFAQGNGEVDKSIVTSIQKSLSRGIDIKRCSEFGGIVFSMAVTFSEDAKVEDVFISESAGCFLEFKDKIRNLIGSNLNSLQLDKEKYANAYFISVTYVMPNQREEFQLNVIPENWSQLFEGIDFMRLNQKKFLFNVPVGIYILPKIE
jgi:hypothetical protein